jgi:hypothetical protein
MKNTILKKIIATLFIVFALFIPTTAQDDRKLIVALYAAVGDNNSSEVKRLLDSGANVNGMVAGSTPLHLAIYYGRAEIIKLLLERGADPFLANEDKTVPGYAGLNSLQLAEKAGRPEIINLIKQAMGAKSTTTPSQNVKTAPTNINSNSTPSSSSDWSGTSRQVPNFIGLWEKAGRFKIGDTVLYSRDRGKSWQRGTVKDIKPIDNVPNLAGVPFYVIEDERKINIDFIDRAFVTTLERQNYWTEFFVGDWNLTLPMTMTERTVGDDVYRVFSGAGRVPPLRVSADGTYIWTVDGNKIIRGRWQPNENGPGLILLNGNRGDDWILYNTSDATERQITKTDTVRLVSKSGNYTPLHGSRIQKGVK